MYKGLILLIILMLCHKPLLAETESAVNSVSLNPLANSLAQAGVVHCQARVQQVSDFLSKGLNSGARLLLPTDHINDHLVSASMEVFDGNSVFYANMDFAPLVAYGCDASVETIAYWPDNCSNVAKKQFAQAKNTGKLRQYIMTLAFGDHLQIFLLPAGNGCVSIKKQALFDKF